MKSIRPPSRNETKIRNSLIKPFSFSQLPLRRPNKSPQEKFSYPQTESCHQSIHEDKIQHNNKASSEQYCLISSKFEAISNSTEESENENLCKTVLIKKEKKSNGSNLCHSDGSMVLKESKKLTKVETENISGDDSTIKFAQESDIYQKIIVNPKQKLNKLAKLRNLEKERCLNQLEKVIYSEKCILENRQKNVLEVQLLERILETLREKERLSKLETLGRYSSRRKESSHTETEEGESQESLNLSCSSHIKEI